MPLKIVKPRKGKSPHYTIRGSYLGVRIHRSAKTDKRSLALEVLKSYERKIEKGQLAHRNEKTFADAALAYVKGGGEKTYLGRLLEHFRDTPLSAIDQDAIDKAATDLYQGATNATKNRSVYTPVSAVMRHSGLRLDLRRPKGAAGNKATAWLWPEQASAVFREAAKLDPEFAVLCIVLCYTGMRLSEALGLLWLKRRCCRLR